jgi:hypothetical protein
MQSFSPSVRYRTKAFLWPVVAPSSQPDAIEPQRVSDHGHLLLTTGILLSGTQRIDDSTITNL